MAHGDKAPLMPQEREHLKWQLKDAYTTNKNIRHIAQEFDVSYGTARQLINDAYAEQAEFPDAEVRLRVTREEFEDGMRRSIREQFERLQTIPLNSQSLNVSAMYANVQKAYESLMRDAGGFIDRKEITTNAQPKVVTVKFDRREDVRVTPVERPMLEVDDGEIIEGS